MLLDRLCKKHISQSHGKRDFLLSTTCSGWATLWQEYRIDPAYDRLDSGRSGYYPSGDPADGLQERKPRAWDTRFYRLANPIGAHANAIPGGRRPALGGRKRTVAISAVEY